MADERAPHSRTRICFPNAKVNLGLQVRDRRSDGYHNIESVFLPIGWTDTLEMEVLEEEAHSVLSTFGLSIPGKASENLILQAHALLGREKKLPPVRFHLIKSIPMGAGLGGGSADGAFAINMLNGHFELGLSAAQRKEVAAELGSDCPFFIQNTTAHVTGRGECIEPLQLQLEGWWVVVLHPGVHISTPQAFGWVKPNNQRPSLSTLKGSSPHDWDGALHNDFNGPRFTTVSRSGESLGCTSCKRRSIRRHEWQWLSRIWMLSPRSQIPNGSKPCRLHGHVGAAPWPLDPSPLLGRAAVQKQAQSTEEHIGCPSSHRRWNPGMGGGNRHELGAENVDKAHHDTNQKVNTRTPALPPAGHTDPNQCHDINGKGVGGARVGLQLQEAFCT